MTGGAAIDGPGYRHANTLLRVDGAQFLREPHALQTEAFGNVSLAVVVRDEQEAAQVLEQLEGNLTGSIYSDTHGADEVLYWQLEPLLRARVGRLLNDKMPTGVAVSAAMNHGGPYPSTGHPGLHRGRHPRIAAPVRRAAVVRQRAADATPRAAARREPGRARVATGGWRVDPGRRARAGLSRSTLPSHAQHDDAVGRDRHDVAVVAHAHVAVRPEVAHGNASRVDVQRGEVDRDLRRTRGHD